MKTAETILKSFNQDLSKLPYEDVAYLSGDTITIYLDDYADEVVNLVNELVNEKYSSVLELIDDEFDKIVYKIIINNTTK